MLDLGEGEDLGGGGSHGVGVAGVQQTLEHHPAVVHVAVDRQVDPAEAAVRDASLYLVLTADEVAARKLGNERVSRTALGAEALGESGLPVPPTSDGLGALGVAAEPAALRHLRIGHDRGGRITLRDARYRDDPRAEAATRARRPRRPAAGGPRRSGAWAALRPRRRRWFGHLAVAGGSGAPVAGAVPQTSQ